MTGNTIFDKILRGEIPSDKVYENDSVFSFRDINPQAPTHVLVIPKKAIVDFSGLKGWNSQDVGNFFKGVAETAAVLGLEEGGYRVVLNNGKAAGQDVPYLHAHILSGRKLTWPPG